MLKSIMWRVMKRLNSKKLILIFYIFNCTGKMKWRCNHYAGNVTMYKLQGNNNLFVILCFTSARSFLISEADSSTCWAYCHFAVISLSTTCSKCKCRCSSSSFCSSNLLKLKLWKLTILYEHTRKAICFGLYNMINMI